MHSLHPHPLALPLVHYQTATATPRCRAAAVHLTHAQKPWCWRCLLTRLHCFAARTKNFSGAELEGLVKSATSFALNRQVDVSNLNKPIDEDNIKVRDLCRT